MSENKSRGPEPVPVHLSVKQREILQQIVRCRHSLQYESLRASIVLQADLGERNERIGAKLGITRQTVGLWRNRWAEAAEQLKELEQETDDRSLRSFVETLLDDAPRSGCPPKFTPEQICRILAVACEPPEESDRPVNRWTPGELADEVVKRGIVSQISRRSVERFLKYGGSEASHVPLLAQQRKRQRSGNI